MVVRSKISQTHVCIQLFEFTLMISAKYRPLTKLSVLMNISLKMLSPSKEIKHIIIIIILNKIAYYRSDYTWH